MDSVNIRKAENNDLRSIGDLAHIFYMENKSLDPILNVKWPYEEEGKNHFKDIIKDISHLCLVAEFNDKLVGFLTGKKTDYTSKRPEKRTELNNLFVIPSFRNKQIGSKLIHQFILWNREVNAKSMLIDAYAQNLKALRFYKKFGFKPYCVLLKLSEEER